jgi:hypothetical protein
MAGSRHRRLFVRCFGAAKSVLEPVAGNVLALLTTSRNVPT